MRCEDYPCCGHEAGDCDGSLYGSNESIIASAQRAWDEGHGYCDHEAGIYECPDEDDDEDESESDPGWEDHVYSAGFQVPDDEDDNDEEDEDDDDD